MAVRIPILAYHKVGPVSELGRRLNVEASRLESHVRFFARRRHRFLTGRELAGTWSPRSVVFTFDDGFRGAVRDGLGALTRHGAVGTVYVVTDLVGGSSKWAGEAEYPLADWDELREAASAGHEIGNHTRRHPYLKDLARPEQEAEIAGAAETLRAAGFSDSSFCLPYGSFSEETLGLLPGLGVTVCMSVKKGIASESDNRLLLPRTFVAYGDALPLLLYKLHLRPAMRRASNAWRRAKSG